MKLFHDEHKRLEVEMVKEGFVKQQPQAGACGGGDLSPSTAHDQTSSKSTGISQQGENKGTVEEEKKNKL